MSFITFDMTCSFPHDFHHSCRDTIVFPDVLSLTPQKCEDLSRKKNSAPQAPANKGMFAQFWPVLAPVLGRRFCNQTNETPPIKLTHSGQIWISRVVNSFGSDEHDRAQGAEGGKEGTSHNPALWQFLALVGWTVPMLIPWASAMSTCAILLWAGVDGNCLLVIFEGYAWPHTILRVFCLFFTVFLTCSWRLALAMVPLHGRSTPAKFVAKDASGLHPPRSRSTRCATLISRRVCNPTWCCQEAQPCSKGRAWRRSDGVAVNLLPPERHGGRRWSPQGFVRRRLVPRRVALPCSRVLVSDKRTPQTIALTFKVSLCVLRKVAHKFGHQFEPFALAAHFSLTASLRLNGELPVNVTPAHLI